MRALVIGIDGGIGRALANFLRDETWDVLGTSRRGTAGTIHLDLERLDTRIELPVVDVAFICAAITRQADCRLDETKSRVVNTEAPKRLADALGLMGTKIQFISTNAVFRGHEKSRTIDTAPNPTTVYGQQKAEAERAILAVDGAAVIRLTKVITPETPLFINWIRSLSAKQPVTAFSDLVMAPLAIDHVVAAMKRIAETGSTGIFQASAPDDVSYLDVCHHLADRLGVSRALVQASTAAENGIPQSEIPSATRLEASRLSALMYLRFPPPLEAIDLMFGSVIEAAKLGRPTP